MKTAPPMREPTYYVLASLLAGPLHGYGIIKRTTELSEGRVKLSAGTLYAALDRLTESGVLNPVRDEVVDGRARRYYALTEEGKVAIHAESKRLASAARVVATQGHLATNNGGVR